MFFCFIITGVERRDLCDVSHPEGLFLSMIVDVNPFRDHMLLRELIDIRGRVDVFYAGHPSSTTTPDTGIIQDIVKEIDTVLTTVEKMLNLTREIASMYHVFRPNQSMSHLNVMQQSLNGIHNEVGAVKQDISLNGMSNERLIGLSNMVSNTHGGKIQTLATDTRNFVDSVSLDSTFAIGDNPLSELTETNKRIQSSISAVLQSFLEAIMSVRTTTAGFGLRGMGSVTVLSVKLLELKVEVVFSSERIGACGEYAEAYKDMKGESAIRVYGSVTTGLVFLGPFLRLDVGFGIGLTISLDIPGKHVTQIHAEVRLLCLKFQTNVFVTNTGLYIYIEAKLGDVYKTTLNIFADVGHSWDSMLFNVNGQFVADADGDGNFNDGYWAALRRVIQDMSDEAEKRISQVQSALEIAQEGLTKAQNWLEDKKSSVLLANSAFDSAIARMETAKDALERAKRPFQNAIDVLSDAQRKVDNLCRIKNCRRICVPGLSCKICWKKIWFVKFPYPCCHWTNCMFSFRDPICELLNFGCRALRAIAYVALEVAKFALRIPMLVLDGCKVVVSAAQIFVDKSRVILDIAVVAIDLAKLCLEGAKFLLEGAKYALEAIKQVVKWGLRIINFVIQYGLESIMDIRNCGFEIQLSGRDGNVFDIHCEVNAFRLGFFKIGFRINFSHIFQTLWHAAKATIETILDGIKHLFNDRKRREITHTAISNLHRVIRETGEFDMNEEDFEFLANETLNVVLNTTGFKNNANGSDYDNRKNIFEEKCKLFTDVIDFLNTATQLLVEMTNETASVLGNVTSLMEGLYDINFMSDNLTVETVGIDLDVALNEFNLTHDDVMATLNSAKENISSDPLLSELGSMAKDAGSILQNQTENANKVMIVNHWLAAMENVSTDYFDNDTCVSFLDCAHYSVLRLYELFVETNITNTDISLTSISEFENAFLELVGNVSHTFQDTYLLSTELREQLDILQSANMFCSTPPVALAPLHNQTLMSGETLTLTCNATGDPKPNFWWFKDEEHLPGQLSEVLTLKDVSSNASGLYYCIAGNVVANITFNETEIVVLGK